MQLEYWDDYSALGLSIRRLHDHLALRQLNVFRSLPLTTNANINQFIDVIEPTPFGNRLTGYTLADLPVSFQFRDQLISTMEKAVVRKWLSEVTKYIQEKARIEGIRNKPESFITLKSGRLLGVAGLRPSLDEYLVTNAQQIRTADQWGKTIRNLEGLRQDELQESGFYDLDLSSDRKLNGNEISDSLNYGSCYLSIIPVAELIPRSLSFVRVADAKKRAVPKVRWKSDLIPIARDPVFGYCIDRIVIDDLLNNEPMWAVFNDKGILLANRKNHPHCLSLDEAIVLATSDANKRFPQVSVSGRWRKYRLPGGLKYREWLVTLPYRKETFVFEQHFPHRNVLLHIRCDERVGDDGSKILFIQELQSDWAQQSRNLGLFTPPWQKEWQALGLKLVILHAIEIGADAVAWTTGSDQKSRWSGLTQDYLLRLYDKDIPKAANKMLSRFGVMTDQIDIWLPLDFEIDASDEGFAVWGPNRQFLGNTKSLAEAHSLLPERTSEKLKSVPGFFLNDKLRAFVAENGLPAWGFN